MIPTHGSIERTLNRLALLGGRGDLTLDGVKLTRGTRRVPIVIGDSFFRKFVCTAGCNVCCTMTHTLDFLPDEYDRAIAKLQGDWAWPADHRMVTVNGVGYEYVSVPKEGRCMFLKPVRDDGSDGCVFWPESPIECAAALDMRIMEAPDRVLITKQPMARAWRYHPEPECKFETVPVREMRLDVNIALFRRYQDWGRYFNVPEAVAAIDTICNFLQSVIDGQNPPTMRQFTLP